MRRDKVPVLTFHGIHSRQMPISEYSAGEKSYAIGDNELVEIAGMISGAGLRTTTFLSSGDAAFMGGETVCVTFDDSFMSHYASALPILIDLGLTAIFFVAVGEVGRRGRLSWSQIRALCDGGMSIQSHTVSHRRLDTLADIKILRELGDSKVILEDATGREVTMLSLPGGRGGRRVERLARQVGYTRVFGSRPGYSPPDGRSGEIRRHLVRAPAPAAGVLRYLFPNLLTEVRGYLLSTAEAAAKDILGEKAYGFLRNRPEQGAWDGTVTGSDGD